MKTGRYSLGQLLSNDDIDQIVIPELQRDYVWTPQNVAALLRSIESNYKEKQALTLTITNGDEAIDARSAQFLTQEYERLRYNTRIGFIYAYYDASDNRRFYLIDGQQRLTTLFLLLLAACVRQGKTGIEHFRKTYFQNHRPRLDYRVREGAHNCLVDFIEYALSEADHAFTTLGSDFKRLSPNYFHDYDNDPTACALLANYDEIVRWLTSLDADKHDIVDYVEHFIEFNYFDTGLSQQGERLYLYMNSRGEELSSQEQIRPTLVKRCGDGGKLAAGTQWEKWQDFFWKHRGKNENADDGFFGFLKVAVVLHQALSETMGGDKPKLKPAVPKTDGHLQKTKEIREEYIRNTQSDQQREWISQYIVENKGFDIQWLGKVFGAYERLSNLYDRSGKEEKFPYPFLRESDWRAESSVPAIHYVPLCGALALAVLRKGVSDDDLYRLAMYLLSRSDDDDNRKVPDTATLRAMSLAVAMSSHGITDIRLLTRDVTDDQNMLRPDDLEFACYRQNDGADWERFFWELTADEALNRFLNGNRDIILRLSTPTGGGPYTLSAARESLRRFKEKIFARRTNERGLLSDLLRYGNISIGVESYSWVVGRRIQRYDLPYGYSGWQLLFRKEREQTGQPEYHSILKAYVDGMTPDPPTPADTWRMALRQGLRYMWYYRFLWHKEEEQVYPHIVLMKKAQARSNLTRSLPAYLLHIQLEGSWLPGDDSRCCALDFCICEKKFKTTTTDNGDYRLKFVHLWEAKQPHWEVFIERLGEKPFSEGQIASLLDKRVWQTFTQDNDTQGMPHATETDAALTETSGIHRLKATDQFIDETGYDEKGMLPSIGRLISFTEELKESLPDLLME